MENLLLRKNTAEIQGKPPESSKTARNPTETLTNALEEPTKTIQQVLTHARNQRKPTETHGNPRKPRGNPRETVGKPRETLQKLNKHERKPCGNPFIRTGFTLWQFTKLLKGQVQETRHPITARQCQYYATGRPLKGEGRKRCSSASGHQPQRRRWGMPAIRINGR